MKFFTKISKVFLGILFSILLICFTNSVSAQSNFIRNDNYDFRGDHYLVAGGCNPDNFNLFIAESILRLF